MFYIVGLGNPGEEHVGTRHNIGFTLLEAFIIKESFPQLHNSNTFSGLVSEGSIEGNEVMLLLPTTYMNASGSAVAKLVPTNQTEKLIVVYDDIDLAFGEIKISFGRGDGGHNGIKSIIEKLGSHDFVRLRVGIAKKSMWTGKLVRPKGERLASFVLGKFDRSEEKEIETLSETTQKVITTLVTKGKEIAMNQFNKK